MLQQFIVDSRLEIAQRCRTKVAHRLGHSVSGETSDHAVESFLDQLAEKLPSTSIKIGRGEVLTSGEWSEMRQTASLHGTEMLRSNRNVKQVVQEYGDICQSVTELAHEKEVPISAQEFGIFNLCLDCAIASAVSSFGAARDSIVSDRAEDLHTRLEQFYVDHERVTKVAAEALAAMQAGSVGVNGATARLLEQSLDELSWLIKRVLPELRLASAKTTMV